MPKETVEIAKAIQVSVFAEKRGEVYLIETVKPITSLTMVKPPLPAVGQDAPQFIRAPEIEVYLVVWILVVERVASALRLPIQIARPRLGVADSEGGIEELVGVDVRLRRLVGILRAEEGIIGAFGESVAPRKRAPTVPAVAG